PSAVGGRRYLTEKVASRRPGLDQPPGLRVGAEPNHRPTVRVDDPCTKGVRPVCVEVRADRSDLVDAPERRIAAAAVLNARTHTVRKRQLPRRLVTGEPDERPIALATAAVTGQVERAEVGGSLHRSQ